MECVAEPRVVHTEGRAHLAAANRTLENLRQRRDDLQAPRVVATQPRACSPGLKYPECPCQTQAGRRPPQRAVRDFPRPVSICIRLIHLNGSH